MVRLLQHRASDGTRRVLAATDGAARFVRGFSDARSLAEAAIVRGIGLAALVEEAGYDDAVDLNAAAAAGELLAPIDHPDPAHVVVTGTGLT
ncbi:MAG: FAH family protein, partial [Sphingomonadales bacterium]